MSSIKPIAPKAERGAPVTRPTRISETVLDLCEDSDGAISRSMKEIEALDADLGKIIDAALNLPDSDTKDDVAAILSRHQVLVDRQLDAKKRESAASKACLKAFRKKMVKETMDANHVDVFTQVLNDASPHAIVRDVLNDFATNLMSIWKHNEIAQKQTSANTRKSAPNSESLVASPEKKCPAPNASTKPAAKKQTETARSTNSDEKKRPAPGAPRESAAKKQTETSRPSNSNQPVAVVARPPKKNTKDNKPMASMTSRSPDDTTGTVAGRVPLNNTTNSIKQARKAPSTGFKFDAAKANAKIRTRTYPSKAQMTAEKQQAPKRASQRALPFPPLDIETTKLTARAEQDDQDAIKDTIIKAAKKKSERTVTKPVSPDGFSHQPAVHSTSDMQQSAAEHVSEDSVLPDSITSEAAMDVQRTQRITTPERGSKQAVPELQTHAQSASTHEDREKTPLDAGEGGLASQANTNTTSLESTTHSMANNDHAVGEIDTELVTACDEKDMASTEVEFQPTAGVSQSTDIAVNQNTVKEVSVIIEDAPNPAEDVKASNSKVNKADAEKATPGALTARAGRLGFLTVGMPGVGKPVIKKKSSSKKKAGAAQNKHYKSAETVVDDEDSEDNSENSKSSRTSKSKKPASDKKNSDASHNSKPKKSTSDDKEEDSNLLVQEGLELGNIIWGPRRRTTGGGSTPRNHARPSKSTDGNKRKRCMDDDSLPNKKVAIEGRYIARPKTRRSVPAGDVDSMDIDSLPTPAAPATLIGDAPSSQTLGMLRDGAVEWDDDDL